MLSKYTNKIVTDFRGPEKHILPLTIIIIHFYNTIL